MIYTVKDIEEPDFGCEGLMDGQQVIDKVTLIDEKGNLLYIEAATNHSLTADLASKLDEQHSIIEQHKFDEAPCSCDSKAAIADFSNR